MFCFFANFFGAWLRKKPCRSERAETRDSDKMFHDFFDVFFLKKIFCIFLFLFFGAWPLGLQVSAIISLGVFSPRPSLICGPLECGLLSVILGGIWVKDFGGHIESLYIKSLYSCSPC